MRRLAIERMKRPQPKRLTMIPNRSPGPLRPLAAAGQAEEGEQPVAVEEHADDHHERGDVAEPGVPGQRSDRGLEVGLVDGVDDRSAGEDHRANHCEDDAHDERESCLSRWSYQPSLGPPCISQDGGEGSSVRARSRAILNAILQSVVDGPNQGGVSIDCRIEQEGGGGGRYWT